MEKEYLKQQLRSLIMSVGAERVGFALATPVDDNCTQRFTRWIVEGKNAEMKYLENHSDLRRDPRLLLEDAKTVISIAFNYFPHRQRAEELPYISMYAYGQDYHDVLRNRLRMACERIKELWGGEFRICIDSAPVHERYWAWRAGLGFQGMNGTFILPGKGSYFFLAEIITTLEVEPDRPIEADCGGCGRCVRECPGKALSGDGCVDAAHCLSYLTIECRDDWQVPERSDIPLYGCDRCQQVCPHNRHAQPTEIDEFTPSDELLTLGINEVESMSENDFRRMFRNSAIKRTKYAGLMRNVTKVRKP